MNVFQYKPTILDNSYYFHNEVVDMKNKQNSKF